MWHVLTEMGDGVELMLVNARHVKNLPGRKTDVSDSAWLAHLAECGLLRGSFIAEMALTPMRSKIGDLREALVGRSVRTMPAWPVFILITSITWQVSRRAKPLRLAEEQFLPPRGARL